MYTLDEAKKKLDADFDQRMMELMMTFLTEITGRSYHVDKVYPEYYLQISAGRLVYPGLGINKTVLSVAVTDVENGSSADIISEITYDLDKKEMDNEINPEILRTYFDQVMLGMNLVR